MTPSPDPPVRTLSDARTPSDARSRLVARMLDRGLNGTGPVTTESPVAAVAPGSRLPLSPAQVRIWFLSKLFPASPEYNVFETVLVDAVIEPAALDRALLTLLRRHDALRLAVGEHEGGPVQYEVAGLTPQVRWHDLSGTGSDAASDVASEAGAGALSDALSDDEVARLVEAVGNATASAPFRLDAAPLFRVGAVRLPRERTLLVLVFHHVIVDFWSTRLLVAELGRLLRGQTLAPPSPVGFLDLVAAGLADRDGARGAADLAYWVQKLGGDLPVLDLPGDRPRPSEPTRRGRAVSLALPPPVVRAVEQFAIAAATTPFVVLLAAYNALLARLTGQTDLVVGTSLAGRDTPAAEQVVGCFVRTAALRTDLADARSFRDVLRLVEQTTLESHDHQSVPFERVVQELRPPRAAATSPVFQTFFGLQSSFGFQPSVVTSWPAATTRLALENDTAKWDLTVSLEHRDGAIDGFVEYATDLFDESTVERYAALYVRLLDALVAGPDADWRAHPLLDAAAREQVLTGLNPYARPRHPYRTMAEPFEEQVARTPEAVALVGDEGTLTYRELNERANRLAHHLHRAGAGRGTFVALCLERGFDMVVAVYAVAKSGAAYVPLDPDLPPARLRFMLEETRPLLVVVDGPSRARVEDGPWRVVRTDSDEWTTMPSHDLAVGGSGRHLVHLLYTSGSTGRPKAVAYPVEGAIADVLWLQRTYPFGPGDANILKTSYGFDVSIWELFWPLYFGARLVVCPPGAHRDPRQLAELVERHQVTTMFLIPTLTQAFLDSVPPGAGRSLRWVFCGGEPVTPRTRDAFHARLPASLVNCYGPTEAGCVTDMVLEPDEGAPIVPLGRPAANFRVYVLDADGEPTPIGVPGEAYLGGEIGLAHGYFRRPAMTAARFVPDPFGPPGARMYRTGDICRYRRDGVLEHLGRRGTQVKVRGMRVELTEIEAVLCEHRDLAEAVVLALGDADAHLVGFVVPRPGVEVDRRDVTEHAARLLPRHMVPATLVPLPGIPVTINGKTDRAALVAAHDTVRRTAAPVASRRVAAPADEHEAALARVFAAVLGRSEVGVDESFFDLGGHSLLIVKLVAACARALRTRPTVGDVFTAPSVRELARLLRESRGDPAASLVPLVVTPGRPLVVLVHAASGSAVPFFALARILGTRFSTVALQSPKDVPAERGYSIAELAARYLDAVEPVRALSPVVLVGWSMGGCVALEMARQWRERGLHPAAVVMLDSWAPPAVLPEPAAQARARQAILRMDVLDGAARADAADGGSVALERLETAVRRNREAFLEYDPAGYDGEVFVLTAGDGPPGTTGPLPAEYTRVDRGWAARIRTVRSQRIPGGHHTLLDAGHALALAGTLTEIITSALAFTEL
ncbi:amino acid adenylation domain-containing protein [Parafrankia sp. FMc6]|uniref:non-ribosomal peptide synthetase n=1 Tax=Parafrankia soli TaxID=2599596 RepID=UPI0034D6D204